MFFAKNVNMLTLSGFKEHLFLDTILPAVLKTLSEAELEAHVHRYFLANNNNSGNVDAYCFHHFRGLESASGFGIFSYLSISSFMK